MDARRVGNGPVVSPESHESLGANINGPSLVRAPDWVDDPLGEFYLYFADHGGEYVRLAYADDPAGPYTVHPPGALHLDEAGPGFDDHVASPDVHVDREEERVRMYYHGCCDRFEDATGPMNQYTRLAVSADGLEFDARPDPLGRFYFRVFEYGGAHYALGKENRGEDQGESGQRVYRSADGLTGFEPGPLLFRDGSRHTAVRRRGDTLDVFYSRIGDAPERILHATVDLAGDWREWSASDPETVLEPERAWEGAGEPVEPSRAGGVGHPVCQLRDPGLFEAGGTTYLLYSVAGERGIGMAELVE
jgi:hypothetical protein